MAKFRAARGRKAPPPAAGARGALPCLILLLLGFVIFMVVMYYGLKGG
jgi:hypothetical protein